MEVRSTPQVTYAVGDIHGRFDLLQLAIEAMLVHGRGRRRRIVFLGDYVDRGPQSRAVIERLIALQAVEDAICLKGNHEDLMVRALTEPGRSPLNHWRVNGGDETLASYGVSAGEEPASIVPRRHVAWMAGLPLTTADEHRIYVHAGLAPGVAFRDQSEEVCLWIRESFLRARASQFEAHVVHGHTPYWSGKPDPSRPELLSHRTNLDTGAFATGILTIGVFDPAIGGGPVELLTAKGVAANPRPAASAQALRRVVRRATDARPTSPH